MAPFTISDLQVFVLTYNRPDYLERMLQSLVEQSATPIGVIVLDNGINPETKKRVERYWKFGIQYINTSSFGKFGNVLTAQSLSARSFTAMFHDDDIVHPDYLSHVIKIINQHPGITLVTCDTIEQPLDQPLKRHLNLHSRGFILNQVQFATFVYNSERPSYAFAIYATSALQKIKFQEIFAEKYGKWGDTPLMIEIVGEGKAAILQDQGGWSGVHADRDSTNPDSLPPAECWIHLEKYFYLVMKNNPLTFSGFSFCMMNFRHLRSGYKRRVKKTLSYREYLTVAAKCRALTMRSSLFRIFSNHLTQKLFLFLTHRYYIVVSKKMFDS